EPGDLAALDRVLKQLKNEDLIETSSSPSALVLDPERILTHVECARSAALARVPNQLKNEDLIETSSSPSALVLDPERIRTNAEYARSRDLVASRRAFEQAIADSGLTASAFTETFKVLEGLGEIDNSRLPWSRFLSSTSPWWFLFDRMLSPDSSAAIAYARTQPQITG